MKRVLADGRWWRVFFWSGGLFFVGLLVTELFGEIPPDVDFKPFFLPLALAVALPARFGWAAGFGA
ncbi:MAG: hypothetical protein IRY95_08585, partial [Clostridia bacterium]|nr:hypothetical protein [Clostridia bacterium]